MARDASIGSASRADAGARGTIVMLVDNSVTGDSRVQKQALSTAGAGWHVVLLGKSPDDKQHTWSLGEATVLLLPLSGAMSKARYEFRRAPLRRPLAYPPGRLAAYRKQQVRAWRSDLDVRRAQLSADLKAGRSQLAVTTGRALLAPQLVLARFLRSWIDLRHRHTMSLREARGTMTGSLDRSTTAFWRRTMGNRAWRRLDPHLWDYELAFGKTIDRLDPDLIHANDFRMLGVGARAVTRARGRGRDVKLVWDAHEFLPGIRPWVDHPRWHPAQRAHEREYAPCADAVVTVSETLADMLMAEHGLTERPTIVLNTPAVQTEQPGAAAVPDLRALCGVGVGVPLLVFSGAAAPQRGLDIMIEALPRLAGSHVVLVVLRPDSAYVTVLRDRAEELGVGHRLHLLPYVAHDQVVPFLAAADIGVIPIQHWPNHEIALITKFFEYSHARLPIVVSDVKTMADMTRETGQGEVFRAEDLDDYIRAVEAVLADPARYRDAYDAPGLLEGWTWTAQAAALDGVYSRLLPNHPPARPAPTTGPDAATRRTESRESA